MTTVAYRPGHPWEKGALERLFQVLNISLVELLPGKTGLSIEERRKFDAEKLEGMPRIEISELNGFLAMFFSQIHHEEPHVGLGPIPSLPGVPRELWSSSIEKVPTRPVQDQSILVRFAGHTKEVGISKQGLIRWENLEYQSAAADSIRLSGQHKLGQGKFHGSKYPAVLDPTDLSRIWIQVPWDKSRMVEIPIAHAYAEYATGLRLYQHRQIVAHYRAKSTQAANAPALMKAKADLMREIVAIHDRRKKHGTAMRLARFVAKQAARLKFTRPVVMEDGTLRTHLDLANPVRATRVEPRSSMSKGVMPKPRAVADEPQIDDAEVETDGVVFETETHQPPQSAAETYDAPSIDDIAARNEDWEK
jgi:putative transposase